MSGYTNAEAADTATAFAARQLYLALFTTPTTAAGGGTEAAAPRQLCELFSFGGDIGNMNEETPTNLPDATYTHWALMDAPSGGSMRAFGRLEPARTVSGGAPGLSFAPGNIVISIAATSD